MVSTSYKICKNDICGLFGQRHKLLNALGVLVLNVQISTFRGMTPLHHPLEISGVSVYASARPGHGIAFHWDRLAPYRADGAGPTIR